MAEVPIRRGLRCLTTGARFLVQPGGSATADRDSRSDLNLDHPSVGRHAFALHNREGRLLLEDFCPRDPIQVNGTPVPSRGMRELADGDRVEYSVYRFVVESVPGNGTGCSEPA